MPCSCARSACRGCRTTTSRLLRRTMHGSPTPPVADDLVRCCIIAIMRLFVGFSSSMGFPLMRLTPSTTMWLVARGSRSAFPL